MSFEDLTPDWTDQPLSDPVLAADVVDLMVSLGDRRRGTFTVLLCDPDDHYRATVIIELPAEFDHLGPGRNTQTCQTVLDTVIPAVHTAPGTGLILALGRPGPAHWPDLDNEWTHAATAICATAAIRLLGFYVATREGVHQLPAPTPAAAA